MGNDLTKILCPWCGAEMVRDGEALVRSDEVAVWMRCISCGASSPLIKGPQTLNLEKLYDMAHAAALRRYTPPLKPMTLEELEKRIAEFDIRDGDTYYVERKDSYSSRISAMYIWYDLFLRKDAKELYGKTWRCWERKPTDEERSAAEWET
jgi:hypothetical protein